MMVYSHDDRRRNAYLWQYPFGPILRPLRFWTLRVEATACPANGGSAEMAVSVTLPVESDDVTVTSLEAVGGH
jgi:hypothetical protein